MALRPAHTTALASLGLVSVLGVALAAGCSTKGPATELVGTSSAALMSSNYDGSEMPKKTIALTFDDGPGDYGAAIADYLASQNIKAAFFDNGDRFKTSADLPNPNGIDPTTGAYGIVQKCLADGHIVGNHTVSHRDLVNEVLPDGATQVNEELSETDTDLTTATATNYIPSGFFLFRSPYGSYNSSVYADIKGKPMDKYVGDINWAFGGLSTNYPNSAADWACWQGQISYPNGTLAGSKGYLTTQQCGDLYLNEITTASTGGIVLMHDPYSWAQGNTLDMVKYIVPKLQAQGFTFVRIDDVPSIRAALPRCDASCSTCNGVGASFCTSCASGKYLAGTSCDACTVCGAGKYQQTACGPASDTVCATCSTCAAGSVPSSACSAKANTVCTACAPGSYAAAGAATCTPCAAGTIAASAGASACTTCPAGTDTAGPGQTTCTACAAGSSSDAGAAACSSCTAGSFAPSMAAACSACPAGTFSAAGAGSCTTCADGTYAEADAASCTACGTCDDGLSCTTDTCDPMTGCVHTPTSGCTESPDAGSDGGVVARNDAGGGAGSGNDAGLVLPTGDDASTGGGSGAAGADAGPDGPVSGSGSGSDGGGGGDTSGSSDGGGGCNQSGGGGSPAFAAFALGALLLRRRRRAA